MVRKYRALTLLIFVLLETAQVPKSQKENGTAVLLFPKRSF